MATAGLPRRRGCWPIIATGVTIRVRANHDIPRTFHDGFGPIQAGMVGRIVSEVGLDVLSVAFASDDLDAACPILVCRRDFDLLADDER